MNDILQNSISYIKTAKNGFLELKNFRLSYLGKVFSLMGKREKITAVSLLLLASVSLFFSARNFYINHTAEIPATGGSYTEGLVGQPVYLNPVLAHTETDLSLVHLIFSSLYKYDQTGQLVTDLAESMPQISEDQKEYTVNIRRNAKWHNGRTLNADDVVFTVQTIQNPDFKSPLRAMWQSTTVEKINDYTVKFKTKDISGPFLQNLTLPIVSKFVWSKVDSQKFVLSPQNLKAIGSGPYNLKEVQTSDGRVQKITLNSFSDYYGSRAKIDALSFVFYDSEQEAENSLQSKDIDGFGISFVTQETEIPKSSSLNTYRIPLKQYQTVFFNTNSKFLNDTSVRKALSLAIDTESLTKKTFGENAFAPSSPFSFADKGTASGIFTKSDINLAQQTLDQAGWKLDEKTKLRTKKNITLEIVLATNDSSISGKTSTALAQSWESLGIKVKKEILPIKDLEEKAIRTRNFDVLLIPLKVGSDPDPFFFWHSSQAKAPGLNLSGLQSQAIDKLISEARTTTNQKARTEKYTELEKLVNSQYAVIFLNQSAYVYSVNKNIKNFSQQMLFEPSMRMYDLPNWYIETGRAWK